MTNYEVIQTATIDQLALFLSNRFSCQTCPELRVCDEETYNKYRCKELLKIWLNENHE